MPWRVRGTPLPLKVRYSLIAVPILMASLDLFEDGCISGMLWTWPDLSHGLVEVFSLATQVKIVAGVLSEITDGRACGGLAGAVEHWLGQKTKSAEMNESDIRVRWMDFVAKLRNVGFGIFSRSKITVTDQGSADVKVLGLMLLARTLNNLKAALTLVDGGLIVEAKIIARCCFENSYWVGALVKEGDKFRTAMVHHEMKHKRMRAQTIFATAEGLKGDIRDKLSGWMKEHKQYEESPTLDPKRVCERAENESYMFYQHLSWDAHPSIETLNRYYVAPDGEGVPGIDVDPVVRSAEVVEMPNLMCLAVLGVFFGVGDLLGHDNPETGAMAAEYQELNALSAMT
jgi:hypothetical protein